jgi:hypothetical protein
MERKSVVAGRVSAILEHVTPPASEFSADELGRIEHTVGVEPRRSN